MPDLDGNGTTMDAMATEDEGQLRLPTMEEPEQLEFGYESVTDLTSGVGQGQMIFS